MTLLTFYILLAFACGFVTCLVYVDYLAGLAIKEADKRLAKDLKDAPSFLQRQAD